MIINLNLTENYVSIWGIPEALREIVQNHIDASKKEDNALFSSANLKTYHKLKKEVTERYLNK